MAGEATGRILIDASIDAERFDDAQRAVLEVEDHIRADPQLVADTIVQTRPVLENPAITPEMVTQAGSDSRRHEIAVSIAGLLAHTADGRYLDFDDATYDVIDADGRHQQLVEIVKSKETSAADLRANKRRVALSGLEIFIRTWGRPAQPPAEAANTSEVA